MTRKKPTALKKLEGNPGKRKLNEDEPKYPPLVLSEAPPDLDEDGRRMWFELGSQLVQIGTLQTVDTYSFWRYCDMFSRWLKTQRWLRANPHGIRQPILERDYTFVNGKYTPIMIPDPNNPGQMIQKRVIKSWVTAPEVTEYHRLSESMRRLEGEFGLTPVARSRLRIAGETGGKFSAASGVDDDPFA